MEKWKCDYKGCNRDSVTNAIICDMQGCEHIRNFCKFHAKKMLHDIPELDLALGKGYK